MKGFFFGRKRVKQQTMTNEAHLFLLMSYFYSPFDYFIAQLFLSICHDE